MQNENLCSALKSVCFREASVPSPGTPTLPPGSDSEAVSGKPGDESAEKKPKITIDEVLRKYHLYVGVG